MKITQSQLEELIDNDTFFSRGEDYFVDGMVELVSVKEDEVKAESLGSKLYKINLYFDKNSGCLDGNCSCPAFADYGPCKHMTAVGLALIAKNSGGYAPSEEFEYHRDELTSLQKSLMKKSKKELVDILIDVASEYPELYYMLEEGEDKENEDY